MAGLGFSMAVVGLSIGIFVGFILWKGRLGLPYYYCSTRRDIYNLIGLISHEYSTTLKITFKTNTELKFKEIYIVKPGEIPTVPDGTQVSTYRLATFIETDKVWMSCFDLRDESNIVLLCILMFAVLPGPQYCAVRWPTWRTSVSPTLYTRHTRDLLHLPASLSLRGTELRHLAGVLSSYTPLERFSGDKVIIISLYICILGNKHHKLSTISNVVREFSFIRFKLPIWEFGLSKISVLTLGSHW